MHSHNMSIQQDLKNMENPKNIWRHTSCFQSTYLSWAPAGPVIVYLLMACAASEAAKCKGTSPAALLESCSTPNSSNSRVMGKEPRSAVACEGAIPGWVHRETDNDIEFGSSNKDDGKLLNLS